MPISFAVIGTNWITHSFVESATSTGEWTLGAVYSRGMETAEAFASKYGLPRETCYTDLDELLAKSSVDAVYIASPNSLHLSQAVAVLKAGKHAIVEKPIVSNVDELDILEGVAAQAKKESGALLIEAYRHIQEPNFKTLRQNLGKLGTIRGASLSYCAYSSRYDAVLRGEVPNVFSRKFGGGCLVDLCVYPLTFAVRLFGPPKKATYHAQLLPLPCADGAGIAVLEYDGFVAVCHASKMYTSLAGVEIWGDDGVFATNATADIDSVVLRNPRDKSEEELAKAPEKLNLAAEAREFARIINENDEAALKDLQTLSRHIVELTTDLRRQAGIVFESEQK
ncbi:hypothetical protein PYCC9005_005657 [Savitreella phatthalungensis]